ncbi:unnamed protein product [Ambrosiozyma monospora]|uniref:Unnamed protein product n=1 Tax=Ambrosiozyma monospora TaxID=43982 RepID=A0A9W6Z6I6_AMBMO|nr:unnamed protein product [Ambrosiozyma monospora]
MVFRQDTLNHFALLPVKGRSFVVVNDCDFTGLRGLKSFALQGAMDEKSFMRLPDQLQELELSMCPYFMPNMNSQKVQLQMYGLRKLSSTSMKPSKYVLPSSLKLLSLHNVNFLHLFDFETCKKTLRKMKFVAHEYPYHCSQEEESRLIPDYIEEIEFNITTLKSPRVEHPDFPPFGMVFPDKVHPNLKVVLKIHFGATVILAEQNIPSFEEQILLGVQTKWYMILKNLPKHVTVVKHPDYQNIRVYFMTLANAFGRSLRFVYKEQVSAQIGRSMIHKIQYNDLINEKAKRRKLNEAVFGSIPDLKVYS